MATKKKAKTRARRKKKPDVQQEQEVEIKIERGIPIPPERPNFRQTLDQLEVGETFRAPLQYWSSIRNAASSIKKKGNKLFKVMKVRERPDDGEPHDDFVRAWRIR